MVVYGLCDTAVTVLGLAVESQMYDSLCVPMPITSTHDNPSPPNLLAKGQNPADLNAQAMPTNYGITGTYYFSSFISTDIFTCTVPLLPHGTLRMLTVL